MLVVFCSMLDEFKRCFEVVEGCMDVWDRNRSEDNRWGLRFLPTVIETCLPVEFSSRGNDELLLIGTWKPNQTK